MLDIIPKTSQNTPSSGQGMFVNFKPKTAIFGVPPLTEDEYTNSIILDSMHYMFIQPGLSNFSIDEGFSRFKLSMGEFKEAVNKIAGESKIGKVDLERSMYGDYIVFAVPENNTYNTSLANMYGPNVFEQMSQSHTQMMVGQIVQAMGGASNVSKYISNLLNDVGKLGLSQKENETLKKSIQQLKAQAESVANFQKFAQNNQIAGILLSMYAGYLGRRLDSSDVWQDSRASLVYNFNITLSTVSGNECIYKKRILEPLIVLMALATPRNFSEFGTGDASFSYDTPFLIKLHIPGVVSIEHGAITDLNISVDSTNFSLYQKPNVVRISFTVTNLYQVVTLLKAHDELPAISDFIKIMSSGVSINDKTIEALQTIDTGGTAASIKKTRKAAVGPTSMEIPV